MKILYHIASIANSGGTEKIITAKANWLARNGHDVVIVTTGQGDRPPYFSIDSRIKCIDIRINYYSLGESLVGKLMFRPIAKLQHSRRIKSVLYQERPDIAIMVGFDIGIKTKDGSKKISECHFMRWYKLYKRGRNPLWQILGTISSIHKKYKSKQYEAFICLTEEDRENWGNDMTNIKVIPNFIERTCEPQALLQNKQAIAVGRLVGVKRFDRLIAAWEHVYNVHPNWTLKIYGDGPLKDSLNKLILDKGLENVVKLCEATKEIMKMYRESSVMVSTSASEGLPMVLLEAMSCGVPIVSFDYKCGPRTLIDDGENGFIVPEGDIKGLAEKICQLIEIDELRKSMGEKAYKKSLLFDKDVVMHKWETLFVELCGK